MLTPDTTKEGAAATLVNLLIAEKKLKGAKVGFLADQDSEGRINDVVILKLKKAKVKTGSSAVLSITTEDTSAAQSQLDAFIEKWKSEKVDTIFMAGLGVSADQFVQKVKDAMPDVQLITDADATANQVRTWSRRG